MTSPFEAVLLRALRLCAADNESVNAERERLLRHRHACLLLDLLPDALLSHLVSLLPPQSLMHVCSTSKALARLAPDAASWIAARLRLPQRDDVLFRHLAGCAESRPAMVVLAVKLRAIEEHAHVQHPGTWESPVVQKFFTIELPSQQDGTHHAYFFTYAPGPCPVSDAMLHRLSITRVERNTVATPLCLRRPEEPPNQTREPLRRWPRLPDRAHREHVDPRALVSDGRLRLHARPRARARPLRRCP